MKTVVLLMLGVVGVIAATDPPAPSGIDAKLLQQLKGVFPSATSFSPRDGLPPHFTAYVTEPRTGQPAVAGYAFWTTELEPLERGYDGPIKILVGMDTR